MFAIFLSVTRSLVFLLYSLLPTTPSTPTAVFFCVVVVVVVPITLETIMSGQRRSDGTVAVLNGAASPVEHLIPISDCPVDNVTVFLDRAEVTRTIVFVPPASNNQAKEGEDDDSPAAAHCVVLQGLTTEADSDSIRVKGATESTRLIREVSYDVHHRKRENKEDQPRVAAAREAQKAAREELVTLRAKLKRVRERDTLVQGYMKSMLVTPTTGNNSSSSSTGGAAAAAGPAAGAGLDVVQKLLEFHQSQSNNIDEEVAALNQQISEAEEKERTATAELRQCQAGVGGTYSSHDVTILLDGVEAAALAAASPEGAVALSMTYIVRSASWAPVYDMRVDDLHADPTPKSIEVTYMGVIRQSTGEDWDNVALRLSTAATPAGRGAPPLPPTKMAQWAPKYQPAPPAMSVSSMSNMIMPVQSRMAARSGGLRMRARMARRPERALSVDMDIDDSDSESSCDADELDSGPDTPGANGSKPTSKRTGASATTFSIERRMTIKSDNKEHKCTIGVVSCPATFTLFATPELEELAYIQARAINGGGLTFLSSSRVSVFLAGSFITKTPIKLTSPGESFIVFFGVEAAVKVDHRVVKDVATSGGQKKGLLRGVTKSSRLVEYRTIITNGLARTMDITVVHLLPRAKSDKIVVTLLQPPRSSVPVTGEKNTSKNASSKSASNTPMLGGGQKEKDDNSVDATSAGENSLGANSVAQNKLTNNVVFTRTLKPGTKTELTFSYDIQWPHDSDTGKVEVV